jgi:IS30 family transposase
MFRHARPYQAARSGGIPDGISIRSRPAQIEGRALPTHWEDVVAGAHQSAIPTIVDRSSRFTVLCKIKDKRAATVTQALVEQMHQLPAPLRQSLTWNRSIELSAHRHFSTATNKVVYFCDPGSP